MTKDDIERLLEMIHNMLARIDEGLFDDIIVHRELTAIELLLYDVADIPRPYQPTPVLPSEPAA
jgi:hypothetical protein